MMMPAIELRYIHIKWNSNKTVQSIEEGQVVPSVKDNGITSFNLCAYTRAGNALMQPAFYIESDTELEPYVLQVDGEKIPLRKVLDPNTRKIWWIEKTKKWEKFEYKGEMIYHFKSQWLNTAGEVTVVIGKTRCRLTISSISIGNEGWKLIFAEFKNELYYLVFNKSGSVRAIISGSASGLLNDRLVEIIDRYQRHVKNILRRPKKRLSETQSKKNLTKLKPVTKTFMEFAANPTLKQYTGKGTLESFDTADNRYIHHTLQHVETIVRGGQTSQVAAQRFWRQTINTIKQQLEGLSDYIEVDEDIFLKELNDYETDYNNWLTGVNEVINDQNLEDVPWEAWHFELDVWGEYNKQYKAWPGALTVNGNKFVFDNGKEWCFVHFEKHFNKFIRSGRKYVICAHVESKLKDQKPHVSLYNIKEIRSLHFQGKLNKLRRLKEELEKNNWRHRLDPSQRKAQADYKSGLEKRQAYLENIAQKFEAAQASLPAIRPKLNAMLRQFSNWCKPASGLPAAMSFVQNADYYGAHLCYRELRECADLDDGTLEALGQLEQIHIGVEDIPKVYERWCLLQVIKVVTEVFNFSAEERWEQRLVLQMIEGLKGGGHITPLEFEHKNTGWKLKLWYEKQFSETDLHRPDITLTLTTKNCLMTIDGVENNADEFNTYTLILDAKYHENWPRIHRDLEELYIKKNYSQSGRNYVFILHPYAQGLPAVNRISPQKWGKHNFYGERKMFDWEEDSVHGSDRRPVHKYGFILLSPIAQYGNYLDNLQRLIGLFLQYPFYSSNFKEEVEFGKYFCINCGSNLYQPMASETKAGKLIYYLECHECGHKAQLTHCFDQDCDTPIFKNGPYWSYHRSEQLEPYNISCPDCGSRFT